MARASQSERARALAWWEEFKKNLWCNPRAARTWKDIRTAGLEEVALRLLWAYAVPGEAYLRRLCEDLRDQASLAKAAVRAVGIASQARVGQQYEALRRRWEDEDAPIKLPPRKPLSPKGPEFFKRRAEEKLGALRSRMGSDEPAELQYALNFLSSSRNVFRPFLYLYMLKLLAARHGVSLGTKRLAALAECANPNRPADPSVLARYLRWIASNLRFLGRTGQPAPDSSS
jgi:hypothetical protein